MRRRPRLWAWLIFIIFQVFIGTGSGLLALSGGEAGEYPTGTTVRDCDIGGLTYNEAVKKLEEHFGFAIGHGKVEISVDGSVFGIPYSAIDTRFDAAKTLSAISSGLPQSKLDVLIMGEGKPGEYDPVITFNTGKLTAELEEIFGIYEREPVPDVYRMDGGKLIYIPVTAGVRIDYDALVKRISGSITSLDRNPVSIGSDDAEIFAAYSGSGSVYGEEFLVMVSNSSIPLGLTDRAEAEEIVKSLNDSVVQPGESLRLSDFVDLSAKQSEGWRDLINRTATAVYQAFLPIRGIVTTNRRQSDIALPYSQAGLEAVITGENGDLVLENGTGQSLLIMGEIYDGSINIYVVSPVEIPCGLLAALKKDIVPPPVIYNVSGDLAKGETRVLAEGSEGYSVDVVRIIGNEREELYTDHYEPVSRIVEIGGTPINMGGK